jgi:hypothetical protein
MAMGCTVKEGETKVSSLGNGKYVVVVAEPGTHEYLVRSEAKDALTLLVEADETQFVRCHIKMGIMAVARTSRRRLRKSLPARASTSSSSTTTTWRGRAARSRARFVELTRGEGGRGPPSPFFSNGRC